MSEVAPAYTEQEYADLKSELAEYTEGVLSNVVKILIDEGEVRASILIQQVASELSRAMAQAHAPSG